MTYRILLTPRIYPPHCIERAIADFKHLAHFTRIDIGEATSSVEMATLSENEAESQAVKRHFLKYVLDMSLESHIRALDGVSDAV